MGRGPAETGRRVKVYKGRYRCSGKELAHHYIHITPYCNLLSGGTGATTLTAPWSSKLHWDPSAADWSVPGLTLLGAKGTHFPLENEM